MKVWHVGHRGFPAGAVCQQWVLRKGPPRAGRLSGLVVEVLGVCMRGHCFVREGKKTGARGTLLHKQGWDAVLAAPCSWELRAAALCSDLPLPPSKFSS